MHLSDTRIKAMKPKARPYKVADGDGLSILVEPSGSKLWRFRYRFGGKGKMISMGPYPEVGLGDARRRREAARVQVAQGVDPSAARQEAKAAVTAPVPPTWRDLCGEFRAKAVREKAAPRTLTKLDWMLGLTSDLNDRPMALITAQEVLRVLQGIEARGVYSSAVRVRGTMSEVFRYAIATARCEHDVPSYLKGALTVPTVQHRPALTAPKAVGGLIRAIRGHQGEPTTRAGLLLCAYLFLRPGEVRALEWVDVDWKAARVTIPGTRMKMKRPHIVPLATQAVAILESMKPFTGRGRLILESRFRKDRPLSDATFNSALRTLGFPGDVHVAHGFRTTASTMLNEQGWNSDWVERQLAHVESNKVRGAYNAAEYLPDRKRMMQAWADHLDSLADAPPD